MRVRLELLLELGDLRPAHQVVGEVLPVLDRDDLRHFLAQHGEGPARIDHPDRRVEAIQNQHFLVENDGRRGHPDLQLSALQGTILQDRSQTTA